MMVKQAGKAIKAAVLWRNRVLWARERDKDISIVIRKGTPYNEGLVALKQWVSVQSILLALWRMRLDHGLQATDRAW